MKCIILKIKDNLVSYVHYDDHHKDIAGRIDVDMSDYELVGNELRRIEK